MFCAATINIDLLQPAIGNLRLAGFRRMVVILSIFVHRKI